MHLWIAAWSLQRTSKMSRYFFKRNVIFLLYLLLFDTKLCYIKVNLKAFMTKVSREMKFSEYGQILVCWYSLKNWVSCLLVLTVVVSSVSFIVLSYCLFIVPYSSLHEGVSCSRKVEFSFCYVCLLNFKSKLVYTTEMTA